MADEQKTAEAEAAKTSQARMRDAVPRNLDMDEVKGQILLDAPRAWYFSPDQSPPLLQYVARTRGLPGVSLLEPFTYCELGCRNGVTSNVLAAALPKGQFVAIGNSAEQVANGKRIAEQGGLDNLRFVECGYGELAAQDLPAFDFITLHGVYSNVSGEDRRSIVQFIARHLKPNGLVYVAYNALPGWAPFLPLRQVVTAYAATAEGGALRKAERALRYLKYLRDNDAVFFELNPLAARFVDDMSRLEPAAILHEYFSEHWQPLNFSQVAAEMGLAKITYCGSTDVGHNYSDVVVPEPFWPLLEATENEVAREIHKSLILNEMFRRDLYTRAERRAPAEERGALFGDVVFGSRVPQSQITREVPLGRVMLQYGAKIYDDLIPAVADGTRTVDEICALPAFKELSRDVVLTALHRLAVGGQIRPFAAKAPKVDKAPKSFRIVHALNRALLKERLMRDPFCALASPVLGSGISIDLTQGLLLLAGDEVGPDKAVARAVELLAESGQPFQKEGVVVEDANEARDLLQAKQAEFTETWAPLLQRFGIIEPA